MKVLLVFPPAEVPHLNVKNINPPLGLAYLAAALENEGHEVDVFDCQVEDFHRETRLNGRMIRVGASPEHIARRIADAAPDVVGVSCLFSPLANQAKEVLRIAKGVRPETVTVFGGLHPTMYPEDGLSDPAVDIVFRGQGELALPRLLEKLAAGDDPATVAGVVVGSGEDGKIREGPPPEFITELDRLPFPAWRRLPMEAYFDINVPHGMQVRAKRVAPMISSRGCPLQCGFCFAGEIWRRRIAYRSPAKVVDEIEWLTREYKVGEVHFEDDNLTVNREHAKALFREMIARVPGIKWNVPGGIAPWTLDDELLALMAESGCYEVNLSVESGSGRVLTEIIGKPDFLAELPGVIAACKKLGIIVHGFFMVGLPGENREEIAQTLSLPLRLGFDDAYFGRWIPVPRTRLYREAIAEGILVPGDVSFSDLHMTGRIPRRRGVSVWHFESMIAMANWRMKMRLLLARPRLFYRRYLRLILRNPVVFTRFVIDQFLWAWSGRRKLQPENRV